MSFADHIDALLEQHPEFQEELENIKAHLYPGIRQPPGQVYMINRAVSTDVRSILGKHVFVDNYVDSYGDDFAVVVHAPYYRRR